MKIIHESKNCFAVHLEVIGDGEVIFEVADKFWEDCNFIYVRTKDKIYYYDLDIIDSYKVIDNKKDDDIVRCKTYNTKIYDWCVFDEVDNNEDYHFICNQLSKLYKWCDKHGGCVDSTRCCKDNNGEYTKAFGSAITCCGIANRRITNNQTGNSFWIGFNYGH